MRLCSPSRGLGDRSSVVVARSLDVLRVRCHTSLFCDFYPPGTQMSQHGDVEVCHSVDLSVGACGVASHKRMEKRMACECPTVIVWSVAYLSPLGPVIVMDQNPTVPGWRGVLA